MYENLQNFSISRPFKKGEAHQRVRRWAGRPAGRPAGRAAGRWAGRPARRLGGARVVSGAEKKIHLIQAAPFGCLDQM